MLFVLGHVSPPGSLGPGIAHQRQIRFPVLASSASMNERVPKSAPTMPTKSLPST
jgi:hypothetical protein